MNRRGTQPTLTEADVAQLARFRGVGRVVLHGDDERAVCRLRDAGLLKTLRGRWTRYGLTDAGRDALTAAGIDPDELAKLGTAPAHRAVLRPDSGRIGGPLSGKELDQD